MELDDIDFDVDGVAAGVGAGMSAGFPTVEAAAAAGEGTVEFPDSAGAAMRAQFKAAKLLKKSKKSGGFQSLGLSPLVYRGVMRLGYKVPTPIQRRALPVALSGKDLCAMARTGSGKTAAFLIPLLEKLQKHCTDPVGARAVVLSPTRELATQTMKFAKSMAKFTDLRMCLLVGGATMNSQFSALAKNPDIIIATPGRLMHLLQEVGDFRLNRVQFCVFDEADRLFEMGFAEQIKEILSGMPPTRQSMLFSATMPRQLMEFARAGLKDPEVVRLDVESTISDKLRLAFFTVRTEEKNAMLLWVLRELLPRDQQAIVFTCTRHHVEFVHNFLKQAHIQSAPIYGQLDMAARKINLAKFRARKCRVLVVTDVAARGIDIPFLDNVINFDFPDKPKLFVHRVGRVARQGRSGAAFSFVAPKEVAYMVDISLFIARKLVNEYKRSDGKATGYSLEEMTPELVHYGKPGPMVIQPFLESASSIVRNSFEVQAMQRTASNAYKQFCKTRGEASRRSVARAKALSSDRVHPLFLGRGEGQADVNDYLKRLNTFRPNQTILEVDVSKRIQAAAMDTMASMRRRHRHLVKRSAAVKAADPDAVGPVAADGEVDGEADAGDSEGSDAEDGDAPATGNAGTDAGAAPATAPVTKLRLSKAQRRKLRKARKAGKPAPATSTQWQVHSSKAERRAYQRQAERAQFISAVRPDAAKEQALMVRQRDKALGAAARLEESVLDLTPDETRAFLASKRIMRWDKRKKKYVKSTLAEMTGSKRKRFRTADGTILGDDGKTVGRLYDQWKKKTKRRVGDDAGEADDEPMWQGIGGGAGAGGGGAKGGVPELASEAKLRKERVKAAKMAALRAKRHAAHTGAAKRKGLEAKNRRAKAKIQRGQAPSRAKMIVNRAPSRRR